MRDTFIALIVILAIAGAVWFSLKHTSDLASQIPANPTATTTVVAHSLTTAGGITIGYPDEYGLAVTPEQVLVHAYIPPCDVPFDYCFYRSITTYAGTNLESAGLRIEKRTDLKHEYSGLTTMPEGYSGLTSKTEKGSMYATSVFPSLGDAAAGHYSSGSLYRLFFSKSCYEFQTRIGETQYANYPEGSIKKFSDADRASVETELRGILSGMTVGTTSTEIIFPQP